MKFGSGIAESEAGIPAEHSAVFSQVASQTNTIISSRAVGVYATQLIREGYATKGYHVKAKSCNWGPMAGFVLADPALGKKGTSDKAKAWQIKQINKAMADGAEVIPLAISDQRRLRLPNLMLENTQLYQIKSSTPNSARPTMVQVEARHKLGVGTAEFTLIRVDQLRSQYKPRGTRPTDWVICYAKRSPLARACEARFYKQIITTSGEHYTQLCALSNPRGREASAPTNYKAAQTGDYDLWGVFPKIVATTSQERKLHRDVVKAATEHDTTGVKTHFWQRDVKGSEQFVRTYEDYNREEGEHTGNLSLLIEEIAVRVNAGCQQLGAGGWVIHHSDEAGRPMVDEIDAEAVVYFPNGDVWVMNSEQDVRALRNRLVELLYMPLFNPIWDYKLGIRRTDIARDWALKNLKRQKKVSFPIEV